MTQKMTPEELQEGLAQFYGTELWYDISVSRGLKVLLTDGTHFLAENAGCYWLMDVIVSHQLTKKVRQEYFQVWKLFKLDDGTWRVTCDDGNDNILATQDIPFSDFPLDFIKLYAIYDSETTLVILLPNEY